MIVLDTHAWIWWAAEPARLSAKARKAIDGADRIGVCAISCWEVAMLVGRNRLDLDRKVLLWIRQALELPRVDLLPLTPDIAVAAANLNEQVAVDPADGMIAAAAIRHGAALITKDQQLQKVEGLRTIW